MSTITIKIDTDNDAFSEYPEQEVARILNELAEGIANGKIDDSTTIRDINGNTVGGLFLDES